MSNPIGIRGVIGVVILSVIAAFLIGGIIMSVFSSTPNQTDKVYLYLSFFLGQGVIIVPPIYYLNFKKVNKINLNFKTYNILCITFLLILKKVLIYQHF